MAAIDVAFDARVPWFGILYFQGPDVATETTATAVFEDGRGRFSTTFRRANNPRSRRLRGDVPPMALGQIRAKTGA